MYFNHLFTTVLFLWISAAAKAQRPKGRMSKLEKEDRMSQQAMGKVLANATIDAMERYKKMVQDLKIVDNVPGRGMPLDSPIPLGAPDEVDIDPSLPVPDGVEAPGGRRLSSTTTTWYCLDGPSFSDVTGAVRIWWGHDSGAASWACNNWIQRCKDIGGCGVRQIEKSLWNCFRRDGKRDFEFVGQTEIWWGHETGAGKWACNNWIPACRDNGCVVSGGERSPDGSSRVCDVSKETDGCSLPQWVDDITGEREEAILTPSCNQHDYCYHFHPDRATCDRLFYNHADHYVDDMDLAAMIVAGAWYDFMKMDVTGNFAEAHRNGNAWMRDQCVLGVTYS